QAKLEIGAVGDPLEREADRVAGEVLRMPKPAAEERNHGAAQQNFSRTLAEVPQRQTMARCCSANVPAAEVATSAKLTNQTRSRGSCNASRRRRTFPASLRLPWLQG